MKLLLKAALTALILTPLSAFTDDLQLNGVAAVEQLRREIYIGALYLSAPAHDPAAVAAQAGNKRMVLRVTADRWSPMQFAQQWNQMILINNGGSTLNANVMDVLSFTSTPKSDLVAGDELIIELVGGASTVTLNGTTIVKTTSANLFNMLLNTWIGARPPSTEFRRDILNLPRDKAGTDLLARFGATKPSEARRKLVSGWGTKETEPAPAAVAAAPTPAAPKPKAETPAPAVAAASAPAPEAKKPTPAPTAEKAAAAATPAVAAVDAEAREAKARQAAQAHQKSLYNQYSSALRKIVTRNISYPKKAVKRNVEGLVVVNVAVSRDGTVLSSSVAQSADTLLDGAALRAIEKSGKLPPVSDELEGSSFSFMIPVVFKLTGS
jgi:TonB family protein